MVSGGGVPGHAGEQWAGGLRPGGAEGDGSVLLCTDREATARQVRLELWKTHSTVHPEDEGFS